MLSHESKRHDSEFSWTDLFKAAVRHTQKEANKWFADLEKANAKPSGGAKATVLSKRNDVMICINTVLKKCDCKAIKAEIVVDNLLAFMGSSPVSRFVTFFFNQNICCCTQCGKMKNLLSPIKISSNQLFSIFFSKSITFTKFLSKKCDSKFP